MEKYWFCDQTTSQLSKIEDTTASDAQAAEGMEPHDGLYTKFRKVETRGRPKKDAFLSILNENRGGSIRTM